MSLNYKNPTEVNIVTKQTDSSAATRNNISDLNFRQAELPGYQPHIDNLVRKNTKKIINDDTFLSQTGPKARLINSVAKVIEQGRSTNVANEQDLDRIKCEARKEAIKLISSLSSAEINTLSKASPNDIKLILRAAENKVRG